MSKRLDDARSIALQAIVEGAEKLLAEGSPVRRMAVGWHGGDETCDVIGEQILAECDDQAATDPADLDLFIATQIYAGGGHTAVIGDFVRASDSARAEVIVTGTVERDIHGGEPPGEIVGRLGIGADDLSLCPHEDRAMATRWLIELIGRRRPRRVFLFHHPQDAVAIAGTRPSLCGEIYLVHHADRQATLGLHQRGSRIIDISPFTAAFTKRVLGLEPIYAPMIVSDPGEPPARRIRPPFTTVSSGSAHKFGGDYAENIACVLEATGGRHIHIGFLKDKRLGGIREHLEGRGIDRDRFEYIEWVPSLAGALIELEADLCISSAPMGGARTAIEAGAAGVPMLAHLPDFATLFGVNHVMPKSLPVWRSIGELVEILRGIDESWIIAHGQESRRYFEDCHHPRQLRNALANLEDSHSPELPDLPISELVDVAAAGRQLTGDWGFLRNEIALLD
ncbi:MAG: hypothetical protein ACR2RV_17805 [Verrucomicrobiales bacterium]